MSLIAQFWLWHGGTILEVAALFGVNDRQLEAAIRQFTRRQI